MKNILYILLILISLSSCYFENRINDYADDNNQSLTLNQLLTSFDLWYVDINQTKGNGDIPFMSRAFTITFDYNGDVWANNNIAGIGNTGNGYGIKIGTFFSENGSNFVEINHVLDGNVSFQVRQITQNKIEFYNARENVTYVLIGYQKNYFDYDALFYDNVVYFLQDFQYWSKIGQNIYSPTDFNNENFLRFFVDYDGYNSFNSSLDVSNVSIFWDYEGDYEILPTSDREVKRLNMFYDGFGEENFSLTIIDDNHIRLTHLSTGNIYDFEGNSYIQYLRSERKKLKIFKQKNYLKK